MSKNTFNQINLRLKTLYDMIPECARMGDVGTDHGYLPIYCIQTGKCGSAVASDLREGPLQTARNNIAAYGLEDRIETLLCSGLDGYRDPGLRRHRNRRNGRLHDPQNSCRLAGLA